MAALKPIEIGEIVEVTDEGVAEIDTRTLLKSKLLICTNSGGGKSWALRIVAEQVMDQVQTFVIDPEGEFASLRERHDAVLVGPNGDLDYASPKVARSLARKLAEVGTNAILDLSEQLDEDRQSFVAEFLHGLFELPKSMWAPRMILIDEAQEFAPQDDPGSVSLAAIHKVAKLGRKRSLCLGLCTQRVASVAKKVTSECNNRLIGRHSEDNDLRRVCGLLGFSKAKWPLIQRCKVGEFYMFGPAFNFEGVMLVKTGQVQTTHPDPDERHKIVVPAPSSAIRSALAKLGRLAGHLSDEAAFAPRAETRTSTPAHETELAALQDEINALEHKCESEYRRGWDAGVASIVDRVQHVIDPERARITVAMANAEVTAAPAGRVTKPRPVVVRQVDREEPAAANGIGGGTKLKILHALLQLGKGKHDRKRVCAVAGVSPRSGTTINAFAILRGAGMIDDFSGKLMSASEKARGEHGRGVKPLPTGPALIEFWRRKVGGGTRAKIFDALEFTPATRDEVCQRAGVSPRSGTTINAFARLRALGVLEDHGDRRMSWSRHLRSGRAA